MKQNEFISIVAAEADMTKKDTEVIIKSVFKNIKKTMSKGEKFSLQGFGSFEVKRREARPGRNPQTGKAVKIPARNMPAFKASKQLKEAINS